MGSTVVTWGEAHFHTKDWAMKIWYAILWKEVFNERRNSPDWLLRLSLEWLEQSMIYIGPGLVWHHIDDYVTSYERRDLLLEIVDRAEKTLRSFDEEIPVEWLKENVRGENWTKPIPTEYLLETLDLAGGFQTMLIEGNPPTDSETTSV